MEVLLHLPENLFERALEKKGRSEPEQAEPDFPQPIARQQPPGCLKYIDSSFSLASRYADEYLFQTLNAGGPQKEVGVLSL